MAAKSLLGGRVAKNHEMVVIRSAANTAMSQARTSHDVSLAMQVRKLS